MFNAKEGSNFTSSWCYSGLLIHFSIRKKWPIWCLRIPVLQSKQVVLICSTPTYLRCIADQTRKKYDQHTLYCRPPCCTPAQHTTCGERDRSRPFFNRLKNLSRSPRPIPLYFRPTYALPDQGPLIADPFIFPEQEWTEVGRLSCVNWPSLRCALLEMTSLTEKHVWILQDIFRQWHITYRLCQYQPRKSETLVTYKNKWNLLCLKENAWYFF